MGAAAIAVDCIADLLDKVSSVSSLKGKAFHVYSEEEILSKTKGVLYPCAGVVYDGMRATQEGGQTAKQGHSAELVCSLMLFFRQETVAERSAKDSAVTVLDAVRTAIKGTRSPSQHFWKFQAELPVGGRNGVLVYIQRWSCPVQLT